MNPSAVPAAGASAGSVMSLDAALDTSSTSQENAVFSVLILGASGDLAKKKTFPALFELFEQGLLPERLRIFGYARSSMSSTDLHERLRGFLKHDDSAVIDRFLSTITYVQGQYHEAADMAGAAAAMAESEEELAGGADGAVANRLFYFALPPKVFASTGAAVRASALSDSGWNRVVVEKPFGRDSASSAKLARELGQHFSEDMVYRIDHYLGKEMVMNLMMLRFANAVFEPLWNRNHISAVTITFKEPFGVEGRAGYFESVGIIRDVIQNHLLQVMSIVAMEPPVTLGASDVRDEKVRVLRSTRPVRLDNTVVGQYGTSRDGDKPGFRQEKGPKGEDMSASTCATFATTVLFINNSRWAGVPFILKAGKALNERKAEVRIQFKEPPHSLFARDEEPGVTSLASATLDGTGLFRHNNELVVRIQPDDAIYLKIMSKVPGLENEVVPTELDLTFRSRFEQRQPPSAYARLLYEVFRGDQSQFVRDDELKAAWAIFTPLLHRLEGTDGAGPPVEPVIYRYGSRGPAASDALVRKMGYIHDRAYSTAWNTRFEVDHLKTIREQLTLSRARLLGLARDISADMEAGLAGGSSDLRMLNTWQTCRPTGSEEGVFWTVDLNGRTLSVTRVELQGGGIAQCGEARTVEVPKSVRTGEADAVNDWIVAVLQGAGVQDGDRIAFVVSFALRSTSVRDAELVEWSKRWRARGMLGKSVAEPLRQALARANLPGVEIAAVLNDTTAVILQAQYANPAHAEIGVVLNQGANAVYVEHAAAVKSLPQPLRDGHVLVNLEWGNFGSASSARLPSTKWDLLLDEQSSNPSRQRFEKMVSADYLGELSRLIFVDLHEQGVLFPGLDEAAGSAAAGGAGGSGAADEPHPSPFFQRYSLPGAAVLDIVKDAESTADLPVTHERLQRHFGIAKPSTRCLKVVGVVCSLIARRAARLVGVATSAVAARIRSGARAAEELAAGDDGRIRVAVNAPMFTKRMNCADCGPSQRSFDWWTAEAIRELGQAIELVVEPDARAAGGAVAAAIADRVEADQHSRLEACTPSARL